MAFMSKRVIRQLCIAAISGVLTVGLFVAVDSKDATFRWSMATAYVGLALIGLSLIIGPINLGWHYRPRAYGRGLAGSYGRTVLALFSLPA